jgi:hypothetical protein
MNYQFLVNISQIAIAFGLILAALWWYFNYYFQWKINIQKVTYEKPFLDICKQWIQVKEIWNDTYSFDIPYCAWDKYNAYNVKLYSQIIVRENNQLKVIDFIDKDSFPENVIITNESWKSISYVLNNFIYPINDTYIYISWDYENNENKKYMVHDIFKYSDVKLWWTRLLWKEYNQIDNFIKDNLITNP